MYTLKENNPEVKQNKGIRFCLVAGSQACLSLHYVFPTYTSALICLCSISQKGGIRLAFGACLIQAQDRIGRPHFLRMSVKFACYLQLFTSLLFPQLWKCHWPSVLKTLRHCVIVHSLHYDSVSIISTHIWTQLLFNSQFCFYI